MKFKSNHTFAFETIEAAVANAEASGSLAMVTQHEQGKVTACWTYRRAKNGRLTWYRDYDSMGQKGRFEKVKQPVQI